MTQMLDKGVVVGMTFDIMGATTEAAATRERPAARHRETRFSMLDQSPTFGDPRLPARFWAKVRILPNGCWEWVGGRTMLGYGRFKVKGHLSAGGWPTWEYAHRVAFSTLARSAVKSLEIDHLCRNRPCVYPTHMELVTHRENLLRSPVQITTLNARKTHCSKGHPFNIANTHHRPSGGRDCRECGRLWQRQKRAKVGEWSRDVII